MADGTRFKSVEAQIQQLQIFADNTRQFMDEARKKQDSYQRSIEELGKIQKQSIEDLSKKTDSKFEELTVMMREWMNVRQSPSPVIQSQGAQIPPPTPQTIPAAVNPTNAIPINNLGGPGILGSSGRPLGINSPRETGGSRNPLSHSQDSKEQSQSWESESRGNRLPKLDFPTFDGSKPRSWIRKCEKYFAIFAIQEMQKVEFAAMYVNGRADVWLQGYLMQRDKISWEEFKEAVCARFGERQGADIVEDFNKLEQKEDLEDYNEKFEELRACMLGFNAQLPENYFVSSYISGLRSEIKALVKLSRPKTLVKLSRPKTLVEAFDQARLHNDVVNAIVQMSKWKGISSGSYNRNSDFSGNSVVATGTKSNHVSGGNVAGDNKETRRVAGLCYKCDDKYYPGHRCKTQTLHSLLAAQVGDVSALEGEESGNMESSEVTEVRNMKPEVYVHLLTGSSPLRIIKIKGVANGKGLTILIDSGATHSFIDPRWATEAGFQLKESSVMEVSIANGEKIYSHQVCRSFKWEMQKCCFVFNPRVLKLGDCDLVLGGDWLKEYSPVLFDFKTLKISFVKDGRQVEFSGIAEEGSLRSLKGITLQKLLKKKVPMIITQVAQLFAVNGQKAQEPEEVEIPMKDGYSPTQIGVDLPTIYNYCSGG